MNHNTMKKNKEQIKKVYSILIMFLLLLAPLKAQTALTQEQYNMDSSQWSDPPPTGADGQPLNNKLIPQDQIAANSETANNIFGKNLEGLESEQRNSIMKGEVKRLSKSDVEVTGEIPEGAKIEGTQLKDKTGKPLVDMSKIPPGIDEIHFESGALKGSITYYQNGQAVFNTNIGPLESASPSIATPRSAPSAGGGGGGDSGGSGGGGGGSGGIEEAFQQAMSLAQQAAQLLGPLAESLKSNGKGKTSTSENSNGGTTTTLEDDAAIALTDEEKEKLLAMQNDPNQPATIETNPKENEIEITNADVIVPEQLAAEVDEQTTLELNGIDGNDPSNPPLSSSSSLNLGTIAAIISITTSAIEEVEKVNFGQHIQLSEHDLDVSGRDLNVYALKTFNDVKAGGQNIKIHSGDIEVKIEGQKILYPRLIKKAPYGFATVSNKLDRDNQFRLQHYTDKKGIFFDKDGIVSVGDITTKHPTKNLVISQIRKEMW
jgi:hypothetical protein